MRNEEKLFVPLLIFKWLSFALSPTICHTVLLCVVLRLNLIYAKKFSRYARLKISRQNNGIGFFFLVKLTDLNFKEGVLGAKKWKFREFKMSQFYLFLSELNSNWWEKIHLLIMLSIKSYYEAKNGSEDTKNIFKVLQISHMRFFSIYYTHTVLSYIIIFNIHRR